MISLIRVYYQILKNKINGLSRSHLIGSCFAIIACYTFLVYFINKLLVNGINSIDISEINLYLMLILLYVVLLTFPLLIYKELFSNKKQEILFMASLKLISCFTWIYVKTIILFSSVFTIIAFMFIPFMEWIGISSLRYILFLLIYLFYLYSVIFLSIQVLFLLFKKNAYKIIIACIGVMEVLGFFAFAILIDKNLTVDQERLVCFFKKASARIVNGQLTNLTDILLWGISIYLLIYFLNYILFSNIYYINGFYIHKETNNSFSKKNCMGVLEKQYFFSKDVKIILRDFKNLKFLIVTLLIFFYSIIKQYRKLEYSDAIILCLTFIFVFGIQLAVEIVSIEKNKLVLFYLSNLMMFEFFYQKWISLIIKVATSSVVYFIFLFYIAEFSWNDVINCFVVGLYFLTLVSMILMYRISDVLVFVWNNGLSAKNIFYILTKILLSLVSFLLVILLFAIEDRIFKNNIMKNLSLLISLVVIYFVKMKVIQIKFDKKLSEWGNNDEE